MFEFIYKKQYDGGGVDRIQRGVIWS